MRYLLCCLSRSSEDKDGTHECVSADFEEKPGTLCGGGGEETGRVLLSEKKVKTKTVDKGVLCRLDLYKSNISEGNSPSVGEVTQRVPPNIEIPLCPVQNSIGEDEASNSAEDNSHPVKTAGKGCDSAFTAALRRILSKGQITAPEQIYSKSTVNDKPLKGFVHRAGGKLRKKKAENSTEKEIPEFLEIPLERPAEPSLPVTCHEKPSESAKDLDLVKSLSDIKGGQGDALGLPGSIVYAPPSPGQHLLQPQVLPVFLWSVPVIRTRLAEGGVSFSFGGGSEQASSSGTGTPASEVVPPATPVSISAPCSCPNPTPMEVDEPQTQDGSLLSQLVQLMNPSAIDNQQMIQQLRDDMQRQLDLQMQLQQQLQQQLIQQEVEARIRQMRAAEPCDTTPERVSFCEWTLVLRYPSNRKIADRPMGTLGYDPLRNYQLKRRSADSQPAAEPSNHPDPGSGHTEPVPICPQPDPPQTNPTPVCPPTHNQPAPERAPASPQAEQPEASKPESEPSAVQPNTDSGSGNVQSEPEHPDASSKPDSQDMKTEPGDEQPPASAACVKKPKSRRVTIKQERLDDDYDVF